MDNEYSQKLRDDIIVRALSLPLLDAVALVADFNRYATDSDEIPFSSLRDVGAPEEIEAARLRANAMYAAAWDVGKAMAEGDPALEAKRASLRVAHPGFLEASYYQSANRHRIALR